MKYMLMMNTPGGGPYQINQWSKQDIEAHMSFMRNLNRKLTAAGELAGAEGLSGPDQAKLVRDGACRPPDARQAEQQQDVHLLDRVDAAVQERANLRAQLGAP